MSCLMGIQFQFSKMKSSGDWLQMCTECTLNMVKMVNFTSMLCVFYLKNVLKPYCSFIMNSWLVNFFKMPLIDTFCHSLGLPPPTHLFLPFFL